MLCSRVVVSVLILAFSAVFVEKSDARNVKLICPANQEQDCRPCWGGTCDSLSSHIQISCGEVVCSPACVCKKDYYLQNNECVPVSQCKVQCPENMVFNHCVKKTLTCQTLNSDVAEYTECKPRCQCAEGYIFSGKKPQDCIKISECQNQTNTQ